MITTNQSTTQRVNQSKEIIDKSKQAIKSSKKVLTLTVALFCMALPFLSTAQHYDNKVTIQAEVQKESMLIPVKFENKTLLINKNVAIELKLKEGQEINASKDN